MISDEAEKLRDTSGSIRRRPSALWITAAWQMGAIVILGSILGLSCNHVRTNCLPLVGDWSPEARLVTESGDSLVISFQDAEAMYFANSAIFLDARPPDLYEEGHIAGALNLPWDEFDTRFQEILQNYSPETNFITYCDGEGCGLSRELAQAMSALGYSNVKVLVNGWTLWQNHNLPVDRGIASVLIR